MTTESAVLECAAAWARHYRMKPDDVNELLTLAWLNWRTASDQGLAPTAYVWHAVKSVRTGRARYRQGLTLAQHRRVSEQEGGSMAGYPDKRPSPFRVIAAVDALETFRKSLTPFERDVVRLYREGARSHIAIARALQVSVSTIALVRNRLKKRYRELTK